MDKTVDKTVPCANGNTDYVMASFKPVDNAEAETRRIFRPKPIPSKDVEDTPKGYSIIFIDD